MFESQPPPHPPEEEPPTSRDEAGEPSGEEDPANEQQAMERQGGQAEGEEPEERCRAAERDEYLALAQRIQADFENYRKRAAREAAAAGERAKSGLVRELLPIVDNLERALRLRRGGRAAPRRGRAAGALGADRRARAERRPAVRPGR